MNRPVPSPTCLLVSILLIASVLGGAGPAGAALKRPTYAAGDRWVYVLDGTLSSFPGVNESQIGTVRFNLVGRVEVEVVGPANVISAGASVPALRVETRTSGFLNGTFSLSVGGTPRTVHVTGSFTATSSEFWEEHSYLPIETHSNSSYLADVSYLITTQLAVKLRLDATTAIVSPAVFDLDVGQETFAQLDTRLEMNSTVRLLGQVTRWENQTDVSSTWRRQVLSVEAVTVEGGTFASYKMNQTLGGFPGIPAGVTGGGNETAYFSNDVGYYVKRVAYANGSPVAETRLKSYMYAAGARPSGLILADLLPLVIVFAAAVVLGLVLWRRRKDRVRSGSPERAPASMGGPHEGGGDRAR